MVLDIRPINQGQNGLTFDGLAIASSGEHAKVGTSNQAVGARRMPINASTVRVQ